MELVQEILKAELAAQNAGQAQGTYSEQQDAAGLRHRAFHIDAGYVLKGRRSVCDEAARNHKFKGIRSGDEGHTCREGPIEGLALVDGAGVKLGDLDSIQKHGELTAVGVPAEWIRGCPKQTFRRSASSTRERLRQSSALLG